MQISKSKNMGGWQVDYYLFLTTDSRYSKCTRLMNLSLKCTKFPLFLLFSLHRFT